jgi:ATP-binding protein involved in chromosome partitioning
MFGFNFGKKKQEEPPQKSIEKVTTISTDFRIREKLNAPIKNTIAVASGKGGVGKSTVSTNLALALAQDGAKVGLLDADIYGPNIPMMVGINQPPHAIGNRIIPNEAYGMKVMSMGFLLKPDQPVVWRGPMLGQALRQFLMDVEWGELDYLVIDMPPGTGDVQLSLTQLIPVTAGVIVTTPQKVALSDVRKGVATFAQLEVPIVGVVENMSYFIAPDTGRRYEIFGTGGGQAYAQEIGVPFLGALPIDPRIAQGGDTGKPILAADPNNPASTALRNLARQVAASLNILNRNRVPKGMIGLGDIQILS